MTLRTEVAMVKTIAAGTPVSYGHHYTAPADTPWPPSPSATPTAGPGDWASAVEKC